MVAAFGVANTMSMAVLERTKEIGLMKAIGARDRDVLTVFLLEAGLVGLCGGAAGVGLSLLLQSLINQAIQNTPSDSMSTALLPFNPALLSDALIVIPPELMTGALVLATLAADETMGVIDLEARKLTRKVKVERSPDGVWYGPQK